MVDMHILMTLFSWQLVLVGKLAEQFDPRVGENCVEIVRAGLSVR